MKKIFAALSLSVVFNTAAAKAEVPSFGTLAFLSQTGTMEDGRKVPCRYSITNFPGALSISISNTSDSPLTHMADADQILYIPVVVGRSSPDVWPVKEGTLRHIEPYIGYGGKKENTRNDQSYQGGFLIETNEDLDNNTKSIMKIEVSQDLEQVKSITLSYTDASQKEHTYLSCPGPFVKQAE